MRQKLILRKPQVIIGLMFSFLLFTASRALAEEGEQTGLWIVSVFAKGGFVMWPILFCSFLAVTIALERAYHLRRNRIFKKDFLDDVKNFSLKGDFERALRRCKATDVSMARIVRAGLQRGRYGILEVERAIETAGAHESTLLQANLRGLGVLANITPMLGLLGTVIGMIKAFNVISQSGAGNPGLVAAGISEALITTATGLIVGIPALAAYHYFRGKVDKYVFEMEEESLQFVEDIQYAIEGISKVKTDPATSENEI